MELKTKYDMGAIVYIIEVDIHEARIIGVETKNSLHGGVAKYNVNYRITILKNSNEREINEERIYDTKFEAAKAWLERQELEPNDVIQSVFDKRKIKDQE